MKDPIQQIEERWTPKEDYYLPGVDSKDPLLTAIKDIQNLLKLVKAYEKHMYKLVNSDGVVTIDQEKRYVASLIEKSKQEIFKGE